MCCRDLDPFTIVEKRGFRTFLLQEGVIKDENEMPARSTIARGGLNGIYDATFDAVRTLLQQAPTTIAVTTDMWTDNYRHRSEMGSRPNLFNKTQNKTLFKLHSLFAFTCSDISMWIIKQFII